MSRCSLGSCSAVAKEVRGGLDEVDSYGQVTIPKAVRDALGLKRGDLVSWELEEGESVRLRVVSPLDLGSLRGVQAGLTEWGIDEDDVAFADL